MAMDLVRSEEKNSNLFTDIKALISFLKTVFDLFENETLNEKGTRRLFSLYVALSELLKDFDQYILYIKDHLTDLESKQSTVLWEVNKLADSIARKHYEVYRLLEELEYGIKSLGMPLFQFIKENRGRVSKSWGYSQDQINLVQEFRKSFPTNLKPQYLKDVYRINFASGKVFIGSVAIKDNPQFRSYLLDHQIIYDGFAKVLVRLEGIVKAQFEKNALW
ncbi:MAG: hypothetical protein L6Q45_08880 [Anaerolineales bacterium]|nr:hypothetical protein [Anaerolineales bacterium]